jgi:hypothetical protein
MSPTSQPQHYATPLWCLQLIQFERGDASWFAKYFVRWLNARRRFSRETPEPYGWACAHQSSEQITIRGPKLLVSIENTATNPIQPYNRPFAAPKKIRGLGSRLPLAARSTKAG